MARGYPAGIERALVDALNAATPFTWSAPADSAIPQPKTGLVRLLSDAAGGQWDKECTAHCTVGAASRSEAWKAAELVERWWLNTLGVAGCAFDEVEVDFGSNVELVNGSSPRLYLADSQWRFIVRAIDV